MFWICRELLSKKGLTALTRTVQVENPKSSLMLLAENDDSQIEKTDQTFTVSLEGRACNFSLVDFERREIIRLGKLLLCEVPKGNSHFKIAMWAGDPAYQPAVQSACRKG